MNKKRFSLIGSLLAVGLLVVIGSFVVASGGHSNLLPPRPIPPQGTGFATSLTDLSPAELGNRLDEIHATGATWVRQDLSWNTVQEDGPTVYKWQAYDRIVLAANARGLQTLFIINFTPTWARPGSCKDSEMCAPASTDAYARFAGAAVDHFKPLGVHSWEIWNEPNISFRYHPAASPDEYAQMLKKAYRAIIKLDASADVIAASTAPSASDSKNLAPADFLQALYDSGAQGYFTAVSAHPYTYPNTPANSGPLDAWGQLARMHEIMASQGDGDKQIWLTEFGAPTKGPANRPNEFVTEAVQAQILTEAVAELKSQKWSGPFFWYDYKDSGNRVNSSENFFGLVRADGSRKPAFDAFKKASLKP